MSGRPPSSESRPKETSFGLGRGRVAVSILGGRGEVARGEGESPPSGCELAMLAVAAWVVLGMASAQATWTAVVAYQRKGAGAVIGRHDARVSGGGGVLDEQKYSDDYGRSTSLGGTGKASHAATGVCH